MLENPKAASESMASAEEGEVADERVAALEKVVQMQEDEMRTASEAEATAVDCVDPFTAQRARANASVVSQWRYQVYRLLVQLHSEERLRSKAEAKARRAVASHTAEMERMQRALSIEQSKRSVSDHSASNAHKRAASLASELESMSATRDLLSTQCSELHASLRSSMQYVDSTAQSVAAVTQSFHSVISRMDAYTRRLCFAASRLSYVLTLLQQHKHWHSAQLLSAEDSASHQQRSLQEQVMLQHGAASASGVETQRALENEVSELQNERKQLLERLQSERAKREQAELHRDEAERKASALHSRLSDAEDAVQNKAERVRSELEAEKQRLAHELERAKSEKEEAVKQAEADAQRRVEEAEREREEELKEAKREADEARRESARTAVVSKQNERELERMREEKERDEREKQDLYDQKVRTLEKQVRDLRKERNSLLASLRQERQQSAAHMLDGTSVAEDNATRDDVSTARLHSSNANAKRTRFGPNQSSAPVLHTTDSRADAGTSPQRTAAYEEDDDEEEAIAVREYAQWRRKQSLQEEEKIRGSQQSRLERLRAQALPTLEKANDEEDDDEEWKDDAFLA